MLPKGFHWSVTARANRTREIRANQPFRGAFFSQVKAPLEDERVVVNGSIGPKIINFAYPFASTNAWLRGQPEENSVMLSILGGDSFDQQPVTYYDANKGNAAVRYRESLNALRQDPRRQMERILPYRNLTPGDIDQGSNFAQVFLGLKDVYQARGGLSHFSMTSQSASVDTPLFQVHGPMYRVSDTLVDEVRFGVVRRSTTDSTSSQPKLIRDSRISPRSTAGPDQRAFAKEYSVVLNSFGALAVPNAGGVPGDYGYKLIDHRQGVVVEDGGTLAKSSTNQSELRARFRWFTDASETRAEIDQRGNWSLKTGLDSTDGGVLNIPTGNLVVDVGSNAIGKLTLRSSGDIQIKSSVGYLSADATAGFQITTPASGTISATGLTSVLTLQASGPVIIDSGTPAGVQLGKTLGLTQHPILVGNPTYLGTLKGWLGAEAAFDGVLGSYGAAAASAWSAIGMLTALIDPSGTVPSLCLSAAAAATAVGSSAPIVSSAISAHLPTLNPNPAGFLSVKTISE